MVVFPRMSSRKESTKTGSNEPVKSDPNQEPIFISPSSVLSAPGSDLPSENDEISALPVDDWVEDMGDGAGRVCCQSLVPLIIGGLGSISAGLILTIATKLELIKNIPQFVAVVPPIQGMKGNLDMTFTSRLSTISHKGILDDKSGRWTLIFHNVALLVAQGVAFSQFVTLISFLMDLPRRSPTGCAYNTFLFLGSVSILAVFTSCCIMTFVMALLVILARHFKLNPDNMATPFASSLGDLASLSLMLGYCYMLFYFVQERIYISYIIIVLMLLTVPFWYWIALKDEEAHAAAKSQWCTLLCASVLTSGAGALLELAAEKYPDITAYQPLISGIAGNRATLMATRLSTILKVHHASYLPFPTRINPLSYYFAKSKETQTARMLLFTSSFFQLFFVLISHAIAHTYSPLHMSALLMIGYLIAAFIQVFILLFLAQLVVTLLWRYKMDPDTHAIPIITAMGDLIGISLLLLLFYILEVSADDAVRLGSSIAVNNSTTLDDTARNCSIFHL